MASVETMLELHTLTVMNSCSPICPQIAQSLMQVFFFVFCCFFFMRTNLCNAPVIQENSYTIANINPETVNTIQKTNKTKQNKDND